jgi:hypothetical protein
VAGNLRPHMMTWFVQVPSKCPSVSPQSACPSGGCAAAKSDFPVLILPSRPSLPWCPCYSVLRGALHLLLDTFISKPVAGFGPQLLQYPLSYSLIFYK